MTKYEINLNVFNNALNGERYFRAPKYRIDVWQKEDDINDMRVPTNVAYEVRCIYWSNRDNEHWSIFLDENYRVIFPDDQSIDVLIECGLATQDKKQNILAAGIDKDDGMAVFVGNFGL